LNPAATAIQCAYQAIRRFPTLSGMSFINKNAWRAKHYHARLPAEIRRYLKGRGISDAVIDRDLIGWNGHRITIPILDRHGDVVTFRYGKNPVETAETPKMLSELGSAPQLYGAERLRKPLQYVVICEGEYDRLVLESNDIPAVTSTAGASCFLADWVPLLANVKRIFVCFDRDKAGEAGAESVRSLLPQAIIVRLPSEVHEGGDVTDYFTKLGRSRVDFHLLLADAAAAAETPHEMRPPQPPPKRAASPAMRRRLDAARRDVPLASMLANYLELRTSGGRIVARCPFHEDRNASFTIYPATNTYYCFGCGAQGDAVTFLMNKESMNLNEALRAVERFRDTNELFGVA
jgi:DNA primase